MCCISDAQRHFQSVSHVFIGICIAYQAAKLALAQGQMPVEIWSGQWEIW